MKEENKKILWPMIMLMALITSYGVTFKYTTLANHIEVSNAMFIFPITFLMSLLLTRYFGKKFAKKAILMATITFCVFCLSMTFISLFRSNDASAAIRASVEFIFIPKHTEVLGLAFNYPIILLFGFFTISFMFANLLAIALYDATEKMLSKEFSFGLSYFLSYIVYTIVYIGGYNTINLLMNKEFKLVTLVRMLTGSFIGLFISGIIMIIVFAIISNIIKKDEEKISVEQIITPPLEEKEINAENKFALETKFKNSKYKNNTPLMDDLEDELPKLR